MACFTACVAEAFVAYGVKKVVAKVNHQKVRAFSGKSKSLSIYCYQVLFYC